MILKKCDMDEFLKRSKNKKIACYGIGLEFQRIVRNYEDSEWAKRVSYLIDNDPQKAGNEITIGGEILQVISLTEFLLEDMDDVILFITCLAYAEIVEELNRIEKLNKIECYLFHFMFALEKNEIIKIRQTERMLIPPTIHYCWFGGGKLSDLNKRCIDSWHKYCPDYRIVEWNEINCDVAETVFTRQAYETRKLGFVPDYFRLKIIYEHGGIYLDTDVELLKNIDDLRYNQGFCGLQFPGEVNLGLGFGAVKRHSVIKKLMERYLHMSFIREDGTLDETASPIYQTEDLRAMGMCYGTKPQTLSGLIIYPMEVLSPQNMVTGECRVTDYSYMRHHYDGSWLDMEKTRAKDARLSKTARLQSLFVN